MTAMLPGWLVQTWAGAALLVLLYMCAWAVAALAARRNDLADVAWGPGFIALAAWLLLREGAPLSARQWAATALVTLWGVRLARHVARRNFRPGQREDRRYAAWRQQWGRWAPVRSVVQVFVLQGLFMLVIAAPLLAAGTGPGRLRASDAAGMALWLAGFLFEVVGDRQLARFRADPANRGRLMDRGLWSWSRHPNYFGEALMWWGLGLLAVGVPGGWAALAGPAVLTWLLTCVSGIPLLEGPRAGDPEWEAYRARTSAFIPMPPGKAQKPSQRPTA